MQCSTKLGCQLRFFCNYIFPLLTIKMSPVLGFFCMQLLYVKHHIPTFFPRTLCSPKSKPKSLHINILPQNSAQLKSLYINILSQDSAQLKSLHFNILPQDSAQLKSLHFNILPPDSAQPKSLHINIFPQDSVQSEIIEYQHSSPGLCAVRNYWIPTFFPRILRSRNHWISTLVTFFYSTNTRTQVTRLWVELRIWW